MDNQYQPMLFHINELVNNLYEELLFNGDAVTPDDIQKSIIQHLQILTGWQLILDDKTQIENSTWSLLYPVVRTHLDYVQAKRMEGSRAINGESFGKDVNTAYQDYKNELDELPKKAFCEEPFWI